MLTQMNSSLRRLTPLWVTLFFLNTFSWGEEAKPNRFEGSIKKFEASDQEDAPTKHGTLFVGSSSIRMWELDKSFPEHDLLNRGFGGSQISDVLHFMDRIVLKYEPQTIFFYCGDNDIGSGKSVERVRDDFANFVNEVHEKLPETKIYFLPIKPSLKRWSMWEDMDQANDAIREMAASDPLLEVLPTDEVLLSEDGTPRKDVFMKDGLHLNETGYELWNEVVEPKLTSR